ncbi:MAG TPA: hypothetical protein VNZ57_03860 [Longimicrobiales bacterium]|nr:hypothetical protein [Longimicrobiales bacterium]
MSARLTLLAAFTAVFLGLPGLSRAQQLPAGVQELIAEMQEIENQLAPLQERAMQDSTIQAYQDAVTDAVRRAMIAADPTNAEKLDRFDSLLTQAQMAEQAGDTATVVALITEARQLQPQLMAAQEAVMSQPEVEERMEAYFDAVEAKMVELDPGARPLIDRLNQLNDQVMAIMQAQAP